MERVFSFGRCAEPVEVLSVLLFWGGFQHEMGVGATQPKGTDTRYWFFGRPRHWLCWNRDRPFIPVQVRIGSCKVQMRRNFAMLESLYHLD